MTDTWVRSVFSSLPWTSGHQLLASVPRAYTLLRVRFTWGFYGVTNAQVDFVSQSDNLMVMGICTTVGTGTETVPNARVNSQNQAPPTQRWIYWEARGPVVSAAPDEADVVHWQASLPNEPSDTKAMVSAKTIPAGQTLNVWASWAAARAWDTTGNVQLWVSSSLAYQPSTT